MNLKRLFSKGKRIVDQRGGVDSVKEDAAELKDIAKGEGSLTDKAKDAAAAIKDPGAPGGEEKPAGHDGEPEHRGKAEDRPSQQGGQGQSQS